MYLTVLMFILQIFWCNCVCLLLCCGVWLVDDVICEFDYSTRM